LPLFVAETKEPFDVKAVNAGGNGDIFHHQPTGALGRRARTGQMKPVNLVFPTPKGKAKVLALGSKDLPLRRRAVQAEEDDDMLDRKIVVFIASPPVNRQARMHLTVTCMLMLGLFCLQFASFAAASSSRSRASRGMQLASVLAIIALGALGLLSRNTHALTLFIAYLYLDAIVNVFGIDSFNHFVIFAIKLAIAATASNVRRNLRPYWFCPIH
jgi:hypothetical protein